MGAVLSPVQDGSEKVKAYASKTLSKQERNHCVTRRELLAVVTFIKYFRHYFYVREFLIRTDHVSLRWLLNFKDPEGQLPRWLKVLCEYDFKIEHRPGKKHGNADGMSRKPCKQCGMEDTATGINRSYMRLIREKPGGHFAYMKTLSKVRDFYWHGMSDQTRTTPFNPDGKSDGMLERFNKTVVDILAKYLDPLCQQRDWDQKLPFALMAYRSATQESTEQTPNKMIFGRELSMPVDVMIQNPSGDKFKLKTIP
ncbi:uncharacterized protein [Haliotis asinina]|uniref:uncharacterized protein n=1 Tax=Haliotis asinina TaxID=109174 RepID=UPI0035323CAC